ncbi:MAG: aminotransferase class I/II-fold pyridoxal phosphate-dependent enzyme [Acidobacteriota bacterium]
MPMPEDTVAGLSLRGRRLVDSPPLPEYLREHFARSVSPFDAASRPDGYIPMCIAENRLVWDLLRPKMAACRDVPAGVLHYDAMTGSPLFRQQLAAFMGRTFLGRRFEPEQIAVLAGAGSVLEVLFHVLADPGDRVLVPTPSYAGFWQDLETRDELAVVPVHTASADGFRLTTELLDRALAGAGRPVRALLFTSPSNPLGTVYPPEQVAEVLDWADSAGIHVVFDEIYALSVFGTTAFTSCAAVRHGLGDRVHIVWAFSKDFAASGLRCGVLVSENEEVQRAVDALAYWSCVSGDTQFLLGGMISDDAWVDGFLTAMQGRLRTAYRSITSALDEEGIPFLPAEAGFFLLCDLRRFLAEPTWDAEHALWRRLLTEANVNLTPGAACRVAEPGFMRLCFAGVPPETGTVVARRLGRTLRARS